MADDETGSYEISAIPGGVDKELARLRAQALQWWDQEERLLTELGLRDGMAVLEPGAGPGFITEQFLRLLPNSAITIVERDPVMIAQAQRYLADKGIERVRFVTASVLETGLPADSFDFAYARLLFQHLPNPASAAREIWRVLKPGGRLVIADRDDGLYLTDPPPTPAALAVQQKLAADHTARGGNPTIARHLPRILKAAGFVQLTFAAMLQHSDILGLEALAPSPPPDVLASFVERGVITAEERDAAAADIQAFYAGDPLVIITAPVASGVKPGPSES
jgi:ubiquinone/menaquinone biosynthesis C-methylase UbiE